MTARVCLLPGELLSPGSLEGMDEGALGEEAGASSSSAGADSDDAMPQPQAVPLVETMDYALGPDIVAGTLGTSVFQSALVGPARDPHPSTLSPTHTHTQTHAHTSVSILPYGETRQMHLCFKLFSFFSSPYFLAACCVLSCLWMSYGAEILSVSFKKDAESFANQLNSYPVTVFFYA